MDRVVAAARADPRPTSSKPAMRGLLLFYGGMVAGSVVTLLTLYWIDRYKQREQARQIEIDRICWRSQAALQAIEADRRRTQQIQRELRKLDGHRVH